jgi:hypothetical protein
LHGVVRQTPYGLTQASAALLGGRGSDGGEERGGGAAPSAAGAADAPPAAPPRAKKPLTLDAVKANKPLSRMLVLLARKVGGRGPPWDRP